MEKTPQLLVACRVMRRVDGGLILAEELRAFPLRQVSKNHDRVGRILDWLRRHAAEFTPTCGARGRCAVRELRARAPQRIWLP